MVTYELYNEGIRQIFSSWIAQKRKSNSKVRDILWSDIESYSNDTDYQRSMKEYEYLKLYLNKKPREIWITDQHNRSGFEQFRDLFLTLVETRNTSLLEKEPENFVPGRVQAGSAYMREAYEIPKRKSFYRTNFAKALTLLFVFVCGGLLYWGFRNGMRDVNWFRLSIIVIPGTLYMVYRVFIRDRTN